MASSRQGQASRTGPSLQDVLNTSQLRVDLAALVALCSDSMRRDLLAVFEPKKQGQKSRNDSTKADLLMDLHEDDLDSNQEDVAEEQRLEQRDLQSSRTQGLRRAALTYFDKWQIDVLRRMGEILSVRPDAIRKARADAKVQAEAAAKTRRDEEYWDWANGVDRAPSRPADATDLDHNILPEGFRANILQLPKDQRILILDSLLLVLLSLEQYTAHSRVLILNFTRIFRLPESTLIEHESKIAEGLLASAAEKMSAEKSTKRQASEDAVARRWKVGLATVAGAALIGVTGGLAAPILAASLGGIMGTLGLGAVATLLGPLATNVVLVGGLFGAYGGRMTGGIMRKYAQEIKDFEFIPVNSDKPPSNDRATSTSDDEGLLELQDPDRMKAHKLRIVIGISGSVIDSEDFIQPWTVFSHSRIEAFGLRWEMDALKQLGRKVSEALQSFAWDFAKFQVLSMVLAGLWPFGLLRAAGSLDSPFAIAKARSDKAGAVLADALINKVQGGRPVTLVGFGLGARVIYSCLLQLAEQNMFGLVESVVLIGAPVPSESASWRKLRAVVSGRVVNVFSENDWMLGFLYRASSVQMGIAGVQEIDGVAGVESYDFTEMIKSHDKYRLLVGTILQRVGFADLDNDVVRQQQEALRKSETQHARPATGPADNPDAPSEMALAEEDEQGHIVLVDNEKETAMLHVKKKKSKTNTKPGRNHPIPAVEGSREDTETAQHTIQLKDNETSMAMLEPEPEPDYGPDKETVRFGSSEGRGFDLEWDQHTS